MTRARPDAKASAMKQLDRMPVEDLAGPLCARPLRAAGHTVTLHGGSCVTIWSMRQLRLAPISFHRGTRATRTAG